ncbi:hypothetical protein YC2023_104694 [Brassica napus]
MIESKFPSTKLAIKFKTENGSEKNKSEYGVRNPPTQLHISIHNEIYSINRIIYFLFVHHSIMEWKIE